MSAPRRYHHNPLDLSFDAVVLGHAAYREQTGVVLSETVFYPESGGQLGDTGTLDGLAVKDVQETETGEVVVLVDGALPPVGASVHGEVDAARRRQHMSLHTAQHLLSRAFLDQLGAETVSSRLSASGSTIDLDIAALDEAKALEAFATVQAVVEEDRPVRQWFPDAETLAALPLRRRPKVSEHIRVVQVEGVDASPCGGTHCTRTGQIGPVTLLSIERYKGKMRVTFLSGRAALAELEARSRAIATLARKYSCGPQELHLAVEKLQSELGEARTTVAKYREFWARSVAERALASSKRVVLALTSESQDDLRALASAITDHPETVALLATTIPEGLRVIVARGAGATLDCGAALKALAKTHGGRGGGSPQRAEGILPASVDWIAVTESLGA